MATARQHIANNHRQEQSHWSSFAKGLTEPAIKYFRRVFLVFPCVRRGASARTRATYGNHGACS
jgi:hypothetical protein